MAVCATKSVAFLRLQKLPRGWVSLSGLRPSCRPLRQSVAHMRRAPLEEEENQHQKEHAESELQRGHHLRHPAGQHGPRQPAHLRHGLRLVRTHARAHTERRWVFSWTRETPRPLAPFTQRESSCDKLCRSHAARLWGTSPSATQIATGLSQPRCQTPLWPSRCFCQLLRHTGSYCEGTGSAPVPVFDLSAWSLPPGESRSTTILLVGRDSAGHSDKPSSHQLTLAHSSCLTLFYRSHSPFMPHLSFPLFFPIFLFLLPLSPPPFAQWTIKSICRWMLKWPLRVIFVCWLRHNHCNQVAHIQRATYLRQGVKDVIQRHQFSWTMQG